MVDMLTHLQTALLRERTIADYRKNYHENLVDQRNCGNKRKNGAFHDSVIAPMLFPVSSLDQVVPPGLHIMLGVDTNVSLEYEKKC